MPMKKFGKPFKIMVVVSRNLSVILPRLQPDSIPIIMLSTVERRSEEPTRSRVHGCASRITPNTGAL